MWYGKFKKDIKKEDVQLSFMKFTAQNIKFDLMENHPKVLTHFEVSLCQSVERSRIFGRDF